MAGGTDIPEGTGSTYMLVGDDEGRTIQLRVAITDDVGNEETLTSAATVAVAVAVAPPPLTVSLRGGAPAAHDGSTEFTFEIEFSEEFPLSYKKLKLHAFDLTDGEVLKAQRMVKSSNISWRITVRPGSNTDVSGVLPVTTRCGAQGPSAPGTAGNCPSPRTSPSQARANKGPDMWTRRGSFSRTESTRVSSGPRSGRRRSWWATNTSGGPRLGRKQAG